MLHISYGDINLNTQYCEDQLRLHFPTPKSQKFIDSLCEKSKDLAKAESLSAYLNLAVCLQENGIDTRAFDIVRNPHGKPYFSGSDIFFSISHTSKYFAVAIADTEIGIDIESKDMSESKMQSIAKRFFLPSEAESISDRESFLKIWTFKEAYAKMKGEPLSTVIDKVNALDDSINKIYKKYNDAVICVCTA